ncbi:nuclear transport factor 2 family protein [Gordonia terrae]|uniref:Nuclear transport factor 2 family protein n=2 Tax=Gordonia terrae TaxID=2055 RepID=A0AAD0K7H5_9ACTN|nr:nuclear transport factor 2 family protein [Gordonia terrae]VTR09615.1 Uncharacterised protein [Clostridioides difficile]ANY22226.1 bile acid 7-alpha dehydratase [Gordonia terrae]AWO82965.1 nuclear transport factor 2 family protein [Gordonia terrae]VTS30054.1 Uncharacterised protein [Gordonia terrae]GAB46305.1 hypothetical protein GOTRE_150_00470 [Gordonia terrae NBRC 100016]
MSSPTVDEQLAELRSIREITSLKHRYLRACDAKDPETFRACFIRSGAVLDYGALGRYDDADPIVEIFRQVALRKEAGAYQVLDMHHAFHPEISLVDDTHAHGRWTLAFRQLNLAERTETVASMEYDDDYVIEDGQWKISRCLSIPLWSMTRPLEESVEVTQGWGLDG